jgi:hypothetical protein
MQTVLLAREIVRMMRWDGDSKSDTHHFASVKRVNHHFDCVTELHRTMGYIGNLSIEDVLKSVLMATLKASTNSSLRAAYHKAWMTSTTPKTCLSLSSKTLAPANFVATLTIADRLATLTSTTLLPGAATIMELEGVTPAPPARLDQS